MTYTAPEGVTIGSFIANTLPASFSAPADAVVTYKIYGTSEGAGEETENLFVEGEYSLDGHYLKSDGSTENNQYWSISEYISVSPNTKYTMYNCAGATQGFCWYDANKNYISGDNFNNRSAVTVTSPATAKYVRLSVCTTTYAYGTKNSDVFKLVIGSAYPSYKIPISLSDGTSTSNYDLFIGASKLYEDEYLDFVEQKIYRTILLTTHDNKDFITSDNKRFCVRRSNNA